jgi:RNA polymerase sigma-70 factor (ECF subfamily)
MSPLQAVADPLAPSPKLDLEIARRLRLRGIEPTPAPGETAEGLGDRLDTALMALWRDSGDRAAFDALYRHSRGRVFAWLRWLLRGDGQRLDPLELLQDTYVNVYSYGSGFRDENDGSFRAWVRTIAGNVLRRAGRRRARAQVPEVSLQSLPDAFQEPVDLARGPDLRVVENEEAGELVRTWLLFLGFYERAFASLSERDRRALELVEVEGHSYAETCRILSVSPSNMKMIMLRARRRLQAHLVRSLGASRAATHDALASVG